VNVTHKDFNIWTICKNHLCKRFHLINFIDSVTLAYIIGYSMNM